MLHVAAVTVAFGGHRALDAVSIDVAEREIVCVLGPSGCGKSTLLRVVAGLQPSSGRVEIDGADQARVPPHRRGVGLMFQDSALFPQRDVAGNVEFGLRMQRLPRPARAQRVAELLELVGLPGAGARPVAELSGGEQQRVALARALAPRPRVLMLDEPLGQLDRSLRERLVVDLRRLFVQLGTTVLAVTHDQGEAFALADRVAVMHAGRIVQIGPPQEVWQRPTSAFVARFLGFRNVVSAEVARAAWGLAGCDGGSVLVRPNGVILDEDGPIAATVATRTFRGDSVAVLLEPHAGPALEASFRLGAAPEPGSAVRVRIDPGEVVPLPE